LAPSLVEAREHLCEALDVLAAHREGLVVIGSHAVHERTKHVWAESTATKDSDLAVAPALISGQPQIDQVLRDVGFRPLGEFTEHAAHLRYLGQPGLWGKGFDPVGLPLAEVDLIVPETLSGGGDDDRAPASTAAHGQMATRTALGIELAVVDRDLMPIESFTNGSVREAWVAGTAALLCAKAFKIAERLDQRLTTGRNRLRPKDGADIWRLMAASDPCEIVETFRRLADDATVGTVACTGMKHLRRLVGSGELRHMAAQSLDNSTGEVEAVYWDWADTFLSASSEPR